VSVIVEFETDFSRLPLAEAIAAVPEIRPEIERETATVPTMPNLFFRAASEDLDAFAVALGEDSTVAGTRRLSEAGGRALFYAQVAENAEVVPYPEWVRLGAEALSERYYNGRWYNRMRFPDRESPREYREFCETSAMGFSLHRLYDAEGEATALRDGLTDEQREVFRLAYERGFFEIPRQVTLEELGEELGISNQPVSERLHQGLRASHRGVRAVNCFLARSDERPCYGPDPTTSDSLPTCPLWPAFHY
jgi:predicted DNA binding protein